MARKFDPWDIIAVPGFWMLMGVLTARDVVRLNWSRYRSKPSSELEL